MTRFLALKLAGLTLFAFALNAPAARADEGPEEGTESVSAYDAKPAASEASAPSSGTLAQFPKAEITQVGASKSVSTPATKSELAFPKVKTKEDEELAKRFSWWPTDAKPAPVKDPERSGYWWWPEIPGEARPWGNQGFVYVRKIIFDYKSSEGEMKPSLVIKRIIKNVKVYFDYDKSDLRQDAVDVLSKALYTLEHNEKADILITGNADVRGSEQYNLKLGEKRAAAVKQYMLDHGLPEDRIRILSRGKMDALAPANDIVGMQKDRNAQFMIAEVEEVMIPAAKAHLFEDKIVEEKQELEGEVKVEVKEYVIQSGDTLWGIAKREYGDGNYWRKLYEFNRDVISNPDRPRKGTKIRIPIE
jgi:outer membrane protein OmpA-like peptidoglycan-associated protein